MPGVPVLFGGGARTYCQWWTCRCADAKDGGTVERDGQVFSVVVLPPKRRGGRRIR
jgi:hypothetical protein